jgi:receptor-type tyrosine-protein phosphatase R
MQVRWLGGEQQRGFLVTQLEVRRAGQRLRLPHFWFTDWPDHKTPEDTAPLVYMAEQVAAARARGRGSIVVHCSAGIGRTGCFIGVYLGMSQLRLERSVDVLATVCAMRQDRSVFQITFSVSRLFETVSRTWNF